MRGAAAGSRRAAGGRARRGTHGGARAVHGHGSAAVQQLGAACADGDYPLPDASICGGGGAALGAAGGGLPGVRRVARREAQVVGHDGARRGALHVLDGLHGRRRHVGARGGGSAALRLPARGAARVGGAERPHGQRGEALPGRQRAVHWRERAHRRGHRVPRAGEGTQHAGGARAGDRGQPHPRALRAPGGHAQPPGHHPQPAVQGDVRGVRHARPHPQPWAWARRAGRMHRRGGGVAGALPRWSTRHGGSVGDGLRLSHAAGGGRRGGQRDALRRRHQGHGQPGAGGQPQCGTSA